ncbi:MAG: hypothetical protein HEQ32_06320 [Vampirovibrio sp.]
MSVMHTNIASDLNDQVDNRYELTLQIADLAKRLMDSQRERRKQDPFGTDAVTYDDEKVIYQALVMKSSEIDLGDGLIG